MKKFALIALPLAFGLVACDNAAEDTVDEEEQHEPTPILWQNLETKVIDLHVMMDTDEDSFNTFLCEVPKSTQLSIQGARFDGAA